MTNRRFVNVMFLTAGIEWLLNNVCAFSKNSEFTAQDLIFACVIYKKNKKNKPV